MNQEYLLQMHVYEGITHSGLDAHGGGGGSPFISFSYWSDLPARYNYCIFYIVTVIVMAKYIS